MRTLLHLSDLHFGCTSAPRVEALVPFIERTSPDLLIVSGDLTQRARAHEYEQALAFFRAIDTPKLIVPGNHDIPALYEFAERVQHPFDRFLHYVGSLTGGTTEPVYDDGEIYVRGVNTVNPWAWKDGHIPDEHLAPLRDALRAQPAHLTKILVSHHAILPVTLATDGAAIALAGHDHRVKITLGPWITANAGTSVSTRLRGGESNSFNLLRVAPGETQIEVWTWDESLDGFHGGAPRTFHQGPTGDWQPARRAS